MRPWWHARKAPSDQRAPGEDKVVATMQAAHTAGAYPGFRSIKRLAKNISTPP